jgi:hypothetical protein
MPEAGNSNSTQNGYLRPELTDKTSNDYQAVSYVRKLTPSLQNDFTPVNKINDAVSAENKKHKPKDLNLAMCFVISN